MPAQKLTYSYCCSCCGKSDATKICSRCNNVAYCSKECQVKHWKIGHKLVCCEKPKVEVQPGYTDHLTAEPNFAIVTENDCLLYARKWIKVGHLALNILLKGLRDYKVDLGKYKILMKEMFGISLKDGPQFDPEDPKSYPLGTLIYFVYLDIYFFRKDASLKSMIAVKDFDKKFKSELLKNMVQGNLPSWFEKQCKQCMFSSDSCREMARRGFGKFAVNTDSQVHVSFMVNMRDLVAPYCQKKSDLQKLMKVPLIINGKEFGGRKDDTTADEKKNSKIRPRTKASSSSAGRGRTRSRGGVSLNA